MVGRVGPEKEGWERMVGGVVKATKGIGGFCSVVPPEARGDDTQTGPGALGRRWYITGLHSVVPNHWDRIGYRVLPNRQSFTSRVIPWAIPTA
jgi:hypothetical protein